MDPLVRDIYECILSFVPAYERPRYALACKRWKALVLKMAETDYSTAMKDPRLPQTARIFLARAKAGTILRVSQLRLASAIGYFFEAQAVADRFADEELERGTFVPAPEGGSKLDRRLARLKSPDLPRLRLPLAEEEEVPSYLEATAPILEGEEDDDSLWVFSRETLVYRSVNFHERIGGVTLEPNASYLAATHSGKGRLKTKLCRILEQSNCTFVEDCATARPASEIGPIARMEFSSTVDEKCSLHLARRRVAPAGIVVSPERVIALAIYCYGPEHNNAATRRGGFVGDWLLPQLRPVMACVPTMVAQGHIGQIIRPYDPTEFESYDPRPPRFCSIIHRPCLIS